MSLTERYSQMVQNIYDESMRRKSEDAYKSQEMTSAIERGVQNARENESRNILFNMLKSRNIHIAVGHNI